jgi:hypothetical protein
MAPGETSSCHGEMASVPVNQSEMNVQHATTMTSAAPLYALNRLDAHYSTGDADKRTFNYELVCSS